MERRRHNRFLFTDLITNTQGITPLRRDNQDDIVVEWFMGLNGNAVMIDITDMDDDIDYLEGSGYLRELGLSDLIDGLFPPIEEETDEQIGDMVEHDYLKSKAIEGLNP